jgi:hypothetical protein
MSQKISLKQPNRYSQNSPECRIWTLEFQKFSIYFSLTAISDILQQYGAFEKIKYRNRKKKKYIYINSFNCSKIKQYTKEQSENCALGIPNMLTIHTNRKLCSWHPKYAHNTYKLKIVFLASQICSQYIQTENCALGIPNMLTIHT